jgi:hypothetical protein
VAVVVFAEIAWSTRDDPTPMDDAACVNISAQSYLPSRIAF